MLRAAARMFIVGGCSERREEGATASCEMITVSSEPGDDQLRIVSTLVGDLNTPRRSPAVTRLQDRLLVVGGCSAPGVHISTAETAHHSMVSGSKVTFKLHELSDKFVGRSCAAFVSLKGNSLLVLGGYDGVECLNDVEVFELREDGSAYGKTLKGLPSRLKNAAAVEWRIGEEVVIFGGWDGSRTLSAIFNYLHKTGDCSVIGVLPHPIETHTATRIDDRSEQDDRVFLVGGWDGVRVRDSILVYHLSSKKSEELPVCLKHARENHVSAVVEMNNGEKLLIVAAGWDGHQALRDIEVFHVLPSYPHLSQVSKVDFEPLEGLHQPRIRASALAL